MKVLSDNLLPDTLNKKARDVFHGYHGMWEDCITRSECVVFFLSGSSSTLNSFQRTVRSCRVEEIRPYVSSSAASMFWNGVVTNGVRTCSANVNPRVAR